jgi:uncharacterized protein (DUF305 family)
MNNKSLLYTFVGILIGAGVTTLVMQKPVKYADITQETKNTMHMDSSMNDMMSSLMHATGNDFDIAFLDAMIVHHEGAVEMAGEALSKASHEELKTLAQAIIGAQIKEIETMKQWKSDWSK